MDEPTTRRVLAGTLVTAARWQGERGHLNDFERGLLIGRLGMLAAWGHFSAYDEIRAAEKVVAAMREPIGVAA